MNKDLLISLIDKYYLGGLTESVKYEIKDKNIYIKFTTSNKNTIGIITSSNINLEDGELGILNTSKLRKFISILNGNINIIYDKKFNIIEKLLISDGNYNIIFPLAFTQLIPQVPSIDNDEYNLSLNINNEFIDKFLECKKVLNESNKVMFDFYNDKINIVFGEFQDFNDKISFSIPNNFEGFPPDPLYFPSDIIFEILKNNKNMIGKIFINYGGLMTLKFIHNENDLKSEYHILALEK